MNNIRFGALVVVGAVFVLVGLSAFTVNERELAIKLRIGEVRQANYEPGLHFKIPIIETVRKFPRRILKIDDAPQEVFTLDRQNMTVDFFVKWRVVDEVAFYTATGGSQVAAVERLREIIKNSVVTEFGKRSTREAISVERMELMSDVVDLARPTAEGLGVKIVDVRVKQVEFVARVRESVYEQMRAERQQLATQTRAEGREAAALITAGAIDGLSIGYRTVKATKNTKGQRLLSELELWEVSLVTFPMLPSARVDAKGVAIAVVDVLREMAAAFEGARAELARG